MAGMSEIRERMDNYGVKSLFDKEAVALLSGIEVDKLSQIDSLSELRCKVNMLEATNLQKQKLEALFELSNRIVNETRKIVKIGSPEDLANLFMEDMRHLKHEEFRVVFLDTKNQIIKWKTIFVGTLASCIVHPREIFKEALLESAASIALCHNHPSGISEPSREDLELTRRLAEVGKLMGISVIDSIVIGNNKFTSLKERGDL